MLTRQLRVLGLMLALIGGIATATSTAGAQDPPTSPVLVMVVTCADATCADVDTAPRVPGIEVHAWDSVDDTWLASCTTDSSSQSGGCTMEIPDGVDYYLTWSHGPEGYTFLGDLIPVNDPQAPSGWIIPFVPEAVDPDETILANVALCTDASCATFETTLADKTISAFNQGDDTFLDSCVTPDATQNNSCELLIPGNIPDFYLSIPADEVPVGYTFHSIIVSDGTMGPITHTLAYAPDTTETVSVPVNALLCDDATCTDAAGDWIPDFEISAYEDGTDTLLDSCLTEVGSQFGGCVLEIPANSPDFYFDWDPAQVPDGYEFYDILVSDGEMGPVVHTLAFVPAGTTPTETPATTTPAPTATATSTAISGLPATGTTGSGETGSTGMLLAAAGVLLGGAFVLGASRLRTR